jgi:hypothetical protein
VEDGTGRVVESGWDRRYICKILSLLANQGFITTNVYVRAMVKVMVFNATFNNI